MAASEVPWPSRDSADIDNDRAEQVDALLTAISHADPEILKRMRTFLLDAMFPSMPDQALRILLPVFKLVTLEVQSIGQRPDP